jgi:hypothetical protein
VVSGGDEVARFQHVAEMLYGILNGQQLAAVCAVFLLNRVEFLGEESERLPGVLDSLLQHYAHGRHGGIRGANGSECPLEWRLAHFEGLVNFRRPGNGVRALDSGARENVMKWCLDGRRVGPVEVQHAQKMA